MISIIMPTYNRFEIALETIQKTVNIQSDSCFELIVINDGDPLPFAFTHPTLSIRTNLKKGVSHARNLGAFVAKYDILLFIDDDMWITADTLELIKSLCSSKLLEDNYFNLNWEYPHDLQELMKKNKVGRFLMHSNYHTLEGRAFLKINHNEPVVNYVGVGSCSFCISKKNFCKIGGYNESILFEGEDVDMAIRLKQQHLPSKLATKITCYHNQRDRLDIAGFIDRKSRGYQSQAKAGIIKMDARKYRLLNAVYPLHTIFEWLFKLMPNHTFFDSISFRLIGLLSVLSQVKAIRESTANG